MSEKVKLTKDQAESLIITKEYSERAHIVETHHLHPNKWTDNHKGLNGMSLDTLIIALYIGYEVEETPEERIKETFERFERSEVGREVGFAGGIKFALNELGIKIDGVNT